MVITGRCQRPNPGSSPGARTHSSQKRLFCESLLSDRPPLNSGEPCPKRASSMLGKPLHAYVRAVVMAMEAGDRIVQLEARGATISRAVDVAEVCRRRSGHIAQGLPETVNINQLNATPWKCRARRAYAPSACFASNSRASVTFLRLKNPDRAGARGDVQFPQPFARTPRTHDPQGPQVPNPHRS